MQIIGHRGAAGLAPENTLEAIEAGIKAGADEVEFDVRITKDGTPILWHDKILLGKKIAESTFAELKKIKSDLATLDEAIRAIKQRVPAKIEIKPNEPIEPIIATIKKLLASGWRASDVKVASFSQRSLLAFHQALPDIATVVNQRWSGVWAAHRARQLKTKYVCMNYHFMWWGFIKSMAKSGYKLSVYTINDPARAEAWAKYGLYGVDTDFPDRFTHK